jgi:hypothetical protein
VKDLGKLRSSFYFLFFGGVAGVIPRRGGSGKAAGFEAWGRLPPTFLQIGVYAIQIDIWGRIWYKYIKENKMIDSQILNLQKDISLIQKYIENNQKTGFQIMNRLLESLSIKLFKTIYNYNLKNLNTGKKNYPAIDLADKDKKIAVQVTTNATSRKINNTIEKFCKHDFYKDYNTLVIYGFCKASKNRILAPEKYIILDTSDLINELIDMNDENRLQDVLNEIRQHVDYSALHPYSDVDCLKILLQTIDRNAIKHGMSCEGDYNNMVDGLNEITELISAGQIKRKYASKPINQFNDKSIVDFMVSVRNNISEIIYIINRKRTSKRNFICLDLSDMKKIDKIKNTIIMASNKIANEKDIPLYIHELYK